MFWNEESLLSYLYKIRIFLVDKVMNAQCVSGLIKKVCTENQTIY